MVARGAVMRAWGLTWIVIGPQLTPACDKDETRPLQAGPLSVFSEMGVRGHHFPGKGRRLKGWSSARP